MPSRLRHVVRALCLAACLAAVAPAGAAAAPASSLTMFGSPGDVGDGVPRVFTSRDADIALRGTTAGFAVVVDDGDVRFDVNVAPPAGVRLKPGLYTGAQRAAFRDEGHPGLDVSGDGQGCDGHGSFNLKSFTTGASGAIESLWMTFEQHCQRVSAPPLLGEIRYRRPRPAGALFATPATVTWPETPPGGDGGTFPITYINQSDGEVTVPRVSLIGSDAGDYAIAANRCAGATLAPGAACAIDVAFTPRLAGPRLARVVTTDSLGRRYVTTLDGRGAPGRTRLVVESAPGEPLTGGMSRTYTPADGAFRAFGSPEFMEVTLRFPEVSPDWRVAFAPPAGALLAPGSHFTGARRYPANGDAPGLAVGANGMGCSRVDGEFTVNAIALTPLGDVRQFGADFVHYCDGGTAALRGTFEYRVPFGDTTPPARVGSLVATRSGSQVELSWTKPSSPDFARAIVRVARGTTAPNSPVSGLPVVATRGTAARTAFGPTATFAVFSVDEAGNVSAPRIVQAPAG